MMTKFFDMIKYAMCHECASETKTTSECFEKQVTKLKEVTKKLKKIIEKTKNTIEKNT